MGKPWGKRVVRRLMMVFSCALAYRLHYLPIGK